MNEDEQATTTPERVVLPDNLRMAILLDPRVEEMSARACQLAHRLGLAHAEGRPKVTASISGSRQIASRIKPQPSRGLFNSRQLSASEEEIYRSGAHTREFDHREKNNIYDGKISVRHTVFDWGQISNRAEARTLNWRAAQLLAHQDALHGKVRHADVRAPLSGTVSAVHVKTVGAVVQAGTMLAEIVPTEAEYLVRAQINPQDIADVQPGQVACISLAAYDPSRYGVVMGVVRRVATNTTQPENAMPFYETIIAIPEVAFTKSPDEPVITAGMPLQVDILGGKRTVMNYIMTPIQKSLATAFREK